MSTGGLSATTPRYVFEGTAEFKSLPAQQSLQVFKNILRIFFKYLKLKPISLEVSSFSPFQLSPDEGALLSLLKIIATPITLYQLRMLKPMRGDEDNVSEKVSSVIAKSLSSPQSSQLYRAPQQQAPLQQQQSVRQAPTRLPVSAGKFWKLKNILIIIFN